MLAHTSLTEGIEIRIERENLYRIDLELHSSMRLPEQEIPSF